VVDKPLSAIYTVCGGKYSIAQQNTVDRRNAGSQRPKKIERAAAKERTSAVIGKRCDSSYCLADSTP
jgi:hypothetical protein